MIINFGLIIFISVMFNYNIVDIVFLQNYCFFY